MRNAQFKSVEQGIAMQRLLSACSLALATILGSLTAQAKALQIDPPKCNQNYGAALMVDTPPEIWAYANGASPEQFTSGMAQISNCFTMIKDKVNAQYTLKVSPLSKEQFNQGAERYSNVEQIESPTTPPKGKMRYGYLEIRDAKTGQLVGRGFGRNNKANLDFSNWNTVDPAGPALSTRNARLVTGSIVNAFFDFSTKPNNFNKNGHNGVIQSTAPSTSPNQTGKIPKTLISNASFIIDASTAPSLDASLQNMLKPLSPREQLEVMTDFFSYVEVESCLHKGGIGNEIFFTKVSKKGCYKRFHHSLSKPKAQMYIAERRMDTKTAYTATSLLGGTRKGGRTRSESFIYFIKHYGKYVDGLNAQQLTLKIEIYRLAHQSVL